MLSSSRSSFWLRNTRNPLIYNEISLQATTRGFILASRFQGEYYLDSNPAEITKSGKLGFSPGSLELLCLLAGFKAYR
jgi:hypothetical protein